MYDDNLKNSIVSKARELGADIVGVCSVESWKDEPLQSPEFWPQNIWPWAKTVIVMAIPLLYPMSATAPSMVFKEQYDTSNRITDNMAYFLAKYIMHEKHYRAIFFPRDCYDGMEALLRHEAAAFSHVVAGYYAGVGTIGDSHNLITAQFGPRIRLVSVITDAPIVPDSKIEKNLCIHCKKCLKCCPSQCFTEGGEEELSGLYGFDRDKCTLYHMDLIKHHRFPCGYCATFCPVGEDIKMYSSVEAVSETGKKHCQTYGS
ncbi:MAG: epoxyqueuosine reductase [Ruminococcaceae bacterium]|nr:epoxyqueuosine reductase [Oscillospiraceae bacterium]